MNQSYHLKEKSQDAKSLEIISYEERLKLKWINKTRLFTLGQIWLRETDELSAVFGFSWKRWHDIKLGLGMGVIDETPGRRKMKPSENNC